jgi:hypothetical protein
MDAASNVQPNNTEKMQKLRRDAQISALDLKNRLIYKRRKDQVFQEIFTTVELLGLLVLFALLPNGRYRYR